LSGKECGEHPSKESRPKGPGFVFATWKGSNELFTSKCLKCLKLEVPKVVVRLRLAN